MKIDYDLIQLNGEEETQEEDYYVPSSAPEAWKEYQGDDDFREVPQEQDLLQFFLNGDDDDDDVWEPGDPEVDMPIDPLPDDINLPEFYK